MSAERDFEGRVALVTGASGGIGAAICAELARAGASVAVCYSSSAARAQALAQELSPHARAQAFASDMSDAAAPAQLLERVGEALGPVDVLVANHGVAQVRAYDELDAAAFDRTIAVNLRAPFLLARGALPGMRERGFGRILFISSTAAFRGGVVGADYAASKSGLHGMAHYLASRVARDGVTVNVLAPGYVDTAMLPGDARELGERVPVGRVGTPVEVASLAFAILRNGYMTNQVTSLDGGIHPRG